MADSTAWAGWSHGSPAVEAHDALAPADGPGQHRQRVAVDGGIAVDRGPVGAAGRGHRHPGPGRERPRQVGHGRVGHDHGGGGQHRLGPQREQVGVAGACAHQGHDPGRRRRRAGRAASPRPSRPSCPAPSAAGGRGRRRGRRAGSGARRPASAGPTSTRTVMRDPVDRTASGRSPTVVSTTCSSGHVGPHDDGGGRVVRRSPRRPPAARRGAARGGRPTGRRPWWCRGGRTRRRSRGRASTPRSGPAAGWRPPTGPPPGTVSSRATRGAGRGQRSDPGHDLELAVVRQAPVDLLLHRGVDRRGRPSGAARCAASGWRW